MGCQGEIYVVYGVQVPCSIVFDEGNEESDDAIIYCINGHNVATDEWKIDNYREDNPDKKLPTIAFYTPWHDPGYGAADMQKVKLSIAVLGDNTSGMGSRHFKEKALIGYVVGNESYTGSATELPPMEAIKASDSKLVRDIQEKLRLDVFPAEFRLHLYFSFLNGF